MKIKYPNFKRQARRLRVRLLGYKRHQVEAYFLDLEEQERSAILTWDQKRAALEHSLERAQERMQTLERERDRLNVASNRLTEQLAKSRESLHLLEVGAALETERLSREYQERIDRLAELQSSVDQKISNLEQKIHKAVQQLSLDIGMADGAGQDEPSYAEIVAAVFGHDALPTISAGWTEQGFLRLSSTTSDTIRLQPRNGGPIGTLAALLVQGIPPQVVGFEVEQNHQVAGVVPARDVLALRSNTIILRESFRIVRQESELPPEGASFLLHSITTSPSEPAPEPPQPLLKEPPLPGVDEGAGEIDSEPPVSLPNPPDQPLAPEANGSLPGLEPPITGEGAPPSDSVLESTPGEEPLPGFEPTGPSADNAPERSDVAAAADSVSPGASTPTEEPLPGIGSEKLPTANAPEPKEPETEKEMDDTSSSFLRFSLSSSNASPAPDGEGEGLVPGLNSPAGMGEAPEPMDERPPRPETGRGFPSLPGVEPSGQSPSPPPASANGEPKAPAPPSASNPLGQDVLVFLMGKLVGQDIFDDNQQLVASQGTVIDADLVKRVELAGRLPELIIYMSLPDTR